MEVKKKFCYFSCWVENNSDVCVISDLVADTDRFPLAKVCQVKSKKKVIVRQSKSLSLHRPIVMMISWKCFLSEELINQKEYSKQLKRAEKCDNKSFMRWNCWVKKKENNQLNCTHPTNWTNHLWLLFATNWLPLHRKHRASCC